MLSSIDHGHDPCVVLKEAVKLLAQATGIDELVAILREHARAVAGSDGIAVILRDGERCRYVAEDAIEPLWCGQSYPLTDCVSGWAMLHNRSVIIPDIETDPRVPLASYARTSIRTLAMVPVGAPEPMAAIGAYWCAFVEPDAGTLRRLEMLGQAAGTALARLSNLRAAEAIAV